MNIDLLESRLNALQDAEDDGLIDYKTRQTVVLHLLEHIDAVCAMQFLLADVPAHLTHVAEIGYTDEAPELHIQIQPGTLNAWRELLAERRFKSTGDNRSGFGFSGPCAVRLTQRRINLQHTLPAEAMAA